MSTSTLKQLLTQNLENPKWVSYPTCPLGEIPSSLNDIKELFNISNDRIYQIIGDSVLWPEPGTNTAQEVLSFILKMDDNTTLLYGYNEFDPAKNKNPNPAYTMNSRCVNGVVGNFINNNLNHVDKFIGHVVNKQSYDALTSWGYIGNSNVRNFFEVVSFDEEDNPNACLGENIMYCDYLTTDLICFEGGLQSLAQVVNCLSNDAKIHIASNFRSERGRTFFSTAEFFKHLKETMESTNVYTENDWEEYMGKYELYDKTKADASTKEHLYLYAKNLFFDNQLYYKILDNVIVYN